MHKRASGKRRIISRIQLVSSSLFRVYNVSCNTIHPIGGGADRLMDTISFLREKRPIIVRIAAKHGAFDVRVFGSVVRGEDRPDSDIDLLVRRGDSVGPWFPAGLILELERELGRHVDVVTETGLNPYLREIVLQEAVPL
jgi:predicted nucleotidyltransferase